MLLIFPATAFFIFYLILHRLGYDRRWSLLASATAWATILFLITEALSRFQLITRLSLSLCWISVCVILTVAFRWIPRSVEDVLGGTEKKFSGEEKWLLVGVTCIMFLVGLLAIVAPPNTWDAMAYHLPRVVFWMSNQSVAFYPTPDYSQLVLGPWSEYVTLHTYLLTGGDRFVNLIEFGSLLGCLVGVSLIAKMLGASVRGQIIAVFVCAMIPEGILEASGPMTTYVVSFWIVVAVAFMMKVREDSRWLNTIWLGLAAGLALLTKGSGYIYLPFLLLTCWLISIGRERTMLLRRAPMMLLLILVINGPHYARCYELTGSPLGMPLPDPTPRFELSVKYPTLKRTLSNTVRNLSLHFGTPVESLNIKVEKGFRLVIRAMGEDPDDPVTNWLGEPFQMHKFSLNETHAGNPLHTLLVIFCVGFVIVKRNSFDKQNRRILYLFITGLLLSYLFFSGALRWHMWMSRLQLPSFVLAAAVCGFVLDRWKARTWRALVCLLLFGMGLAAAASNRTRSLIPWSQVDDIYHPRAVLYFNDMHEQLPPTYISAAESVLASGCGDIGIDTYSSEAVIRHLPRSFFLYPLFPLMKVDGTHRKVWYTGVHNATSRYQNSNTRRAPCVVVCIDCAQAPEKWNEYRDVGGHASVFDYVVVFGAAGPIANYGASHRE